MENRNPTSLRTLRERSRPNTKWAAFENHAMDSSLRGHLQFIMFGEGCTYETCPEKMPDTEFDLGWKYVFVGVVNLETGEIEGKRDGAADRR